MSCAHNIRLESFNVFNFNQIHRIPMHCHKTRNRPMINGRMAKTKMKLNWKRIAAKGWRWKMETTTAMKWKAMMMMTAKKATKVNSFEMFILIKNRTSKIKKNHISWQSIFIPIDVQCCMIIISKGTRINYRRLIYALIWFVKCFFSRIINEFKCNEAIERKPQTAIQCTRTW